MSVKKKFDLETLQHRYYPMTFVKISKTRFFYRTLPVAASESQYIFDLQIKIKDCG